MSSIGLILIVISNCGLVLSSPQWKVDEDFQLVPHIATELTLKIRNASRLLLSPGIQSRPFRLPFTLQNMLTMWTNCSTDKDGNLTVAINALGHVNGSTEAAYRYDIYRPSDNYLVLTQGCSDVSNRICHNYSINNLIQYLY